MKRWDNYCRPVGRRKFSSQTTWKGSRIWASLRLCCASRREMQRSWPVSISILRAEVFRSPIGVEARFFRVRQFQTASAPTGFSSVSETKTGSVKSIKCWFRHWFRPSIHFAESEPCCGSVPRFLKRGAMELANLSRLRVFQMLD